MTTDTQTTIETALRPLIGLPLSIARNAADMRGFHFGRIRPNINRRGDVGSEADYMLHLQCSWRLVDRDGIITGLMDRFVGADRSTEPDFDDWRAGTLQQVRIAEFMGTVDEATRSHTDPVGRRIVTTVRADEYGSIEIAFNDGTRLQAFADGSTEENWRFFASEPEDAPHLVICAGKIEDPN